MAHADLEKEKIKADELLVAAELTNRSHQRHIRVLSSTNLTAALEKKHDRLNGAIAHDKIELAHVRQANRLMEGRIEKLEKEKTTLEQELDLWRRRKSSLINREELVRARDKELKTISTRL